MTSAEICRDRGWKAGDVIETSGTTVTRRFRLTAVGDEKVLARCLAYRNTDERVPLWNDSPTMAEIPIIHNLANARLVSPRELAEGQPPRSWTVTHCVLRRERARITVHGHRTATEAIAAAEALFSQLDESEYAPGERCGGAAVEYEAIPVLDETPSVEASHVGPTADPDA